MQTMSNLDYYYLIRELNEKLGGAFLKKISLLSQSKIRLSFYKQGEKHMLLLMPGKALYLTKYREDAIAPTSFIMKLRKHLSNAVLKKISQINFDRIISLEFTKKDETFFLIFEQFSDGNIILCDKNMKIIAALKIQKFSYRLIKPREPYSPPPLAKKNPSELSVELLHNLKGECVASLSNALNLPPFYLEEACARSHIDFAFSIEKLNLQQLKELYKNIISLLSSFSAHLFYENSKPVFFAPFELKKFSYVSKSLKDFSEALDTYYNSHVPEITDKTKKKASPGRIAERQREAIEQFVKAAEDAKKKADAISSNYILVQKMIDAIHKARKKNISDREIEKKLSRFVSVKIKNKTAEVEF